MNLEIKNVATSVGEATLITIKNKMGLEVCFCNYGASVYYIGYPDSKGCFNHVNVVEKDFESFIRAEKFYGSTVGRVAGRIKNGQAIIDNKECRFDQNEMGNCLHGGEATFAKRKFDYQVVKKENQVDLIFNTISFDNESGFPGDLDIKVIYTMYEDENELLISYIGKCNKPTLINLTSHIYFNLNGGVNDILDQELYIRASKVAQMDQTLIIEKFIDVPEYLDFRVSSKLKDKIRHPLLLEHHSRGIDHPFLFDGINDNIPSAILKNEDREIQMFTNFKGMICYGCNYPSRALNLQNQIIEENYALTLEALDPFMEPEEILLIPNQTYYRFIRFKFK